MPKVVDHDQRRAEIIGALWEVISERGTEGASLMTVARAAGVSVGRIQHYFASKQDLVQAGCQAIVDMAEAGYRDRTRESDPWRTLADLLTQSIPTTTEFRMGAAVWYAYMARAVVDPGIGEIVRRAAQGTHEEVRSLLRAGGAPEDLATALLGMSAGLTQHVLVGALSASEATAAMTAEIDRLREASAAEPDSAVQATAQNKNPPDSQASSQRKADSEAPRSRR